MKTKNFKLLVSEIKKIGNILLKRKKNLKWSEIVDLKKKTTVADFKVDKLLKRALLEYGFKVPYFSEEVNHNIKERPKRYWLADPIDGTSSWLDGFDGYVIQAAYIENNEPLFSFIFWPEKNKFFHCFKGEGFFLNGEKVITNVGYNDTLKIIDNYPEPRGFVKRIIDYYPDIKYLEMGSLGLKSILVGSGFCDLFIKTTKFRDWDVIPAKLMLNEINFKMLSLDGNTFDFGVQNEYNKGLLVYNPLSVNKELIDHIKKLEIKFEF